VPFGIKREMAKAHLREKFLCPIREEDRSERVPQKGERKRIYDLFSSIPTKGKRTVTFHGDRIP